MHTQSDEAQSKLVIFQAAQQQSAEMSMQGTTQLRWGQEICVQHVICAWLPIFFSASLVEKM